MQLHRDEMSTSTSDTGSTSTARPTGHYRTLEQSHSNVDSDKGGIPVTPAVLRSIFASSRSPLEERSISRIAFFRSVHEHLLRGKNR